MWILGPPPWSKDASNHTAGILILLLPQPLLFSGLVSFQESLAERTAESHVVHRMGHVKSYPLTGDQHAPALTWLLAQWLAGQARSRSTSLRIALIWQGPNCLNWASIFIAFYIILTCTGTLTQDTLSYKVWFRWHFQPHCHSMLNPGQGQQPRPTSTFMIKFTLGTQECLLLLTNLIWGHHLIHQPFKNTEPQREEHFNLFSSMVSSVS